MLTRRTGAEKIIQVCVLLAALAAAVYFAVSERTSLGQTYQSVYINGAYVGSTSLSREIKPLILKQRRNMAAQSTDRLCMDFTWESKEEKKPFVTLLTEEEMSLAIEDALAEEAISGKERAYTVMLEGYRGDFATLAQVKEFLELVKESADEENQYEAVMMAYDSQIGGIMRAGLAVRNAEDVTETEEDGVPDPVTAGVCRNLTTILDEAANPADVSYQTGILDMEFVEEVYVYQNYVDADALCDVKEEAQEVTKEKESNKIYIVEQGECLSVIALDQGTTVASIVALNGLEDANNIREGQELIIAVPEPDLKLRVTMGVVYEEDYTEDAVIIPNDDWYTTREVVLQEGTTGHRERNDKVVYENGIETSREMIHENVMIPSTAAVIERGTIIPPTYIKPIYGGVFSSGYGLRWGRTHKGVDWACSVGTTVFASSAGTVIQAAYSSSYGYNVVISHPDGRMTRYAHCSKLLVQAGDYVEQGDTLALSGNTGDSTGPHLHFELYINGSTVNPLDYISY